ncbi:hypothetical protein [uncultured Agrobacterium sp.]|uniref:hypothetical protein n=1 Tax=uncultured Agrobacterium sp. TaxID=157277 RepID=UPI0025D65B79|nr:hypothetical protein [uncultured Agrobacterium sp.]
MPVQGLVAHRFTTRQLAATDQRQNPAQFPEARSPMALATFAIILQAGEVRGFEAFEAN